MREGTPAQRRDLFLTTFTIDFFCVWDNSLIAHCWDPQKRRWSPLIRATTLTNYTGMNPYPLPSFTFFIHWTVQEEYNFSNGFQQTECRVQPDLRDIFGSVCPLDAINEKVHRTINDLSKHKRIFSPSTPMKALQKKQKSMSFRCKRLRSRPIFQFLRDARRQNQRRRTAAIKRTNSRWNRRSLPFFLLFALVQKSRIRYEGSKST